MPLFPKNTGHQYTGNFYMPKQKNPKPVWFRIQKKRVMGIEPTYLAWKASVLPLNYTRMRAIDGTRTRDPNLGKVVLHQLSHYRIYFVFADVSQRLV